MDIQVQVLFTISALNALFSYFIVRGERSVIKSLFSVFVLVVGLWSLGLAFFIQTNVIEVALKISTFYYIAPALIVLVFLYFSIVFLKYRLSLVKIIGLLIPFLLLVASFIFDKHFLIKEIYLTEGISKEVVLDKMHYIYYVIYILSYVVISYYFLIKAKISRELNTTKNTQLNFIITGTSISYFFAMIFNLFLPYFGNYELIWLGPIFTIIMIGAMAYAILKHHLFDIKLIVTEILIFILWITIAIELFLADSVDEIIIESIILLAVVSLGILLIRSVSNEVKRREETERLFKELQIANKKLKEVDKQKTDFISIASHQLRTPLTAIKGYTSMILEGTFGKMSSDINGVIDKVFQSSQRLIYIVNDMLDVTRIEEGRLRYSFEDVKVANLIKEVFEEFKVNTKAKKLKFTFNIKSEDAEILVNADYGKLRQSFTNVIDNAIKYTEAGFVELSLKKTEDNKNIIFEINDSGIGMSKEQLKSVFEKFERSKDAIKTHTEGSGLGLYVAKEMIKAMGGVIWATSKGLKRGSQFYVEFPIKSK